MLDQQPQQPARSMLNINLNADLLEKLFPEGSEARVQLTSAAANEILRRMSKETLAHALSIHKQKLANAIDNELRELGVLTPLGDVKMFGPIRESVKAEVLSLVSTTTHDFVRTSFEELLKGKVTALTDLAIEARVDKIIRERLMAALQPGVSVR